jgi:ATP-binding cassette subfamily B (MDR/TAP) protein 1
MAFFDNLASGEISSRIMIDMDIIQEALTSRLSHTITAVAKFCSAFVIAFVMYWKLALILCPAFILTVLITVIIGTETLKNQKSSKALSQEASGIAEEALQSVHQVYAFGIQGLFTSKYHGKLLHAGLYESKARRATTVLTSWLNAMPYLIYPLGFWAGLFFFMKGELSIANYTTCALTIAIGSFAIAKISPATHELLSSMASARTVLSATGRRSFQYQQDSGGSQLESIRGDLEFSAVTLKYPSRVNTVALDKVSFKCNAMSTTAILGASGSGKTSILNLLQRFYEPVEGQICRLINMWRSTLAYTY